MGIIREGKAGKACKEREIVNQDKLSDDKTRQCVVAFSVVGTLWPLRREASQRYREEHEH
jgi:hypothetical protein